MPRHDKIPDWKFGDVLASDSTTQEEITLVLFLRWRSRHDGPDANESTFEGMIIKAGDVGEIGDFVQPYCGWWQKAEDKSSLDPKTVAAVGRRIAPRTGVNRSKINEIMRDLSAHAIRDAKAMPSVVGGARGGKTIAQRQALAEQMAATMTKAELSEALAKALEE
jgi:hypothetical protein